MTYNPWFWQESMAVISSWSAVVIISVHIQLIKSSQSCDYFHHFKANLLDLCHAKILRATLGLLLERVLQRPIVG